MQLPQMIRTWGIVAACVAVLSIAACDRSPTRPVYDGYTLHGVVLDAGSGDPLGDVHVLVGWEGSEERNPFTATDANGELLPACRTEPEAACRPLRIYVHAQDEQQRQTG